MISINKALILIFALFHVDTIADEVCGNDADFVYFANGQERLCSWFRLKEDRREEFCLIGSINNACKHTCGECCEDDPTYRFDRNNGIEADCAWVGENAKRINRYCIRDATKFRNGSSIRNACPDSCNYCFGKTVAPTAGPSTIVITAAPVTSAPTKTKASPSAGASVVPTRPPFPMPSTKAPKATKAPGLSTKVPKSTKTPKKTKNPTESVPGVTPAVTSGAGTIASSVVIVSAFASAVAAIFGFAF